MCVCVCVCVSAVRRQDIPLFLLFLFLCCLFKKSEVLLDCCASVSNCSVFFSEQVTPFFLFLYL